MTDAVLVKDADICTAIEDGKRCGKPHQAHGLCMKHLQRLRRNGSAHTVLRRWRATRTYSGAHQLVGRLRGRASDYRCQHCPAAAAHWCYQGDAEDEIIDERGRRFSPSGSNYEPLCVQCHSMSDRGRPRRRHDTEALIGRVTQG